MTVIRIEYEKNFSLEVRGHAGYAEPGKDIVCASVSTACNFLIAALSDVAFYEIGEGSFGFTCKAKRRFERIIDAALQILKDLEREFPQNVKIIY